MQARYYDPALGRFLSIDPVGFTPRAPYMFNRYTYVGNDPINSWDPFGENPACAIPAVGIAVCAPMVAAVVIAGCAVSAPCREVISDAVTEVVDEITTFPEIYPPDTITSETEPQVTPTSEETVDEFIDRVKRDCRKQCTTEAVDEYVNGEDIMPPIGGEMGDKIGRCIHGCIDEALENIDDVEAE